MPTSLGIMQTFFGPSLPPPPWEGCWPTPHEAATKTRATNTSTRTPLAPPPTLHTSPPLSGPTVSARRRTGRRLRPGPPAPVLGRPWRPSRSLTRSLLYPDLLFRFADALVRVGLT